MQKINKTKQNKMPNQNNMRKKGYKSTIKFILSWPSTVRYGTHPYVRFHWRKLFFLCKSMSIADSFWLGVGAHACFPLSACIPCACCHSLCNSRMSVLLCLEDPSSLESSITSDSYYNLFASSSTWLPEPRGRGI